MKYFLTYLLLVQACGSVNDRVPESTKTVYPGPAEIVEDFEPVEELKPFIDLFYAQAENYGVFNLGEVDQIFVDTLEAPNAAVCEWEVESGAAVQIRYSKEIWVTMGFYQKVEMVAHEMGHCLLHRRHTPDSTVSFMRSKLHSNYDVFYYYDDMWAELFNTKESGHADHND